jgi:hypothetical protein
MLVPMTAPNEDAYDTDLVATKYVRLQSGYGRPDVDRVTT